MAFHRVWTLTAVDPSCSGSKPSAQNRTQFLVPEPHGTHLKATVGLRATISGSSKRGSPRNLPAVVVDPCDLDRTTTVIVLSRLTRVP
ncbi:hypothetical protein HID58_017067 [Brassica napus]|uniref:Uncharacterized protein n=1 Tax=Brassica napus TaxID=3708 RepID=A0ABQ8D602_BRANA|nr:hypothetical protein HID58_017067 [Brassica napus]